jgi:hypothetical protein
VATTIAPTCKVTVFPPRTLTFTAKLPTLPFFSTTSAPVNRVMLSRCRTLSKRAATIRAPSRFSGKSFPHAPTWPPTSAHFSTRCTESPRSESASAARIPATPAPITSAAGTVSTRTSASGLSRRALAIPAPTSWTAFAVAFSRSCRCAQEHCSRMFTWVYMYGFRPARPAMARKVFRWSLGEQEAITIRSSPSWRMASTISCWEASEHAKRNVLVVATPSTPAAAAQTLSAST